MSTTTFPPSDPLTWKQADADVHVATRNGEFAGLVVFDGTAPRGRGPHRTARGAFDSLDDARSALERRQHAKAPIAQGRALVLPRAFRRRPRRARA